MKNLSPKKCLSCKESVALLTKDQSKELNKQTPEWRISDDSKKISRTFTFKNFTKTRLFFNQVADIAESENHHPDFEVHYNSMILTLWTHSINGLSKNDFDIAAKIDVLA